MYNRLGLISLLLYGKKTVVRCELFNAYVVFCNQYNMARGIRWDDNYYTTYFAIT